MGIQSDYLDVAVGIVVVFFVTSLVVSGVNEGIQWAFRARARFLWGYLHNLVSERADAVTVRAVRTEDRRPAAAGEPANPPDDAPAAASSPEAQDGDTSVTATSLLARLRKALAPIEPNTVMKRTKIKAIPTASLVQAWLEVFADLGQGDLRDAVRELADVLAGDDTAADAAADARLARAVAGTATGAVVELARDVRAATSAESARAAGAAFAARLTALPEAAPTHELAAAAERLAEQVWTKRKADGKPPAELQQSTDELTNALTRALPAETARRRIEAAIRKLPENSAFRKTLHRHWESAAREIDEFRTGLERWVDAEWARLSGLYRQSVRWILIALGVVVAVVLNVDALHLVHDLWRNPEGRAALVAEAESVTATSPAENSDSAEGTDPVTALRDACVRDVGNDVDTEPTSEEAADQLGRVRECVTDNLDRLTELRVVDDSLIISPEEWLDDWWPGYQSAGESSRDWFVHLLGVAITAVALGLGATFWFDLLKRIIGLRRGIPRRDLTEGAAVATTTTTEYRVFLASPGDVQKERRAMRHVIADVNDYVGDDDAKLELVTWETHAAPAAGSVQDIINADIGEYDIFVGIMLKRFGTPTEKWGSGTEEEFERAYDLWEADNARPLLFYFLTRSYTLSTREEVDQLGRVIDFKERLQGRALHWDYPSTTVFPRIITKHLVKRTRGLRNARRAGSDLAVANPATIESLRELWPRMESDLQRSLSIAYNEKRQEGDPGIKTAALFSAFENVRSDGLAPVLEELPDGAVPPAVEGPVNDAPYILEEQPWLSGCVSSSLERLGSALPEGRKLTAVDVFVDIARHGTGESVRQLRSHGVGRDDIELLVATTAPDVLLA